MQTVRFITFYSYSQTKPQMGSKHGFPASRKIDMLIRSGNSFSCKKIKSLQKVASSLCNANRTIAWSVDICQISCDVKVVSYFEIHAEKFASTNLNNIYHLCIYILCSYCL